MRPIPEHFKNCSKDVEFLFVLHIQKLESLFKRSYQIVPYLYAHRTSYKDMTFEGFYDARTLKTNSIPLEIHKLPASETADRIYEGYSEIINHWEEITKYHSILRFLTLSEFFLKVAENVDDLLPTVGKTRMLWMLQVESNFYAFKGRQLIEEI